MTWLGWVVIADLALSGLIVVGRTGTTRTYRRKDAVSAVLEVSALIVGILAIGTGHLR